MARGKARAGWDIDLADGGIREEAFAHMLFKCKVEHKANFKAPRTGNVFFEYQQKGKASGIAISTADFWAIEFDLDCWVVLPMERVRKIAVDWYHHNHISGGDFNQYKGVPVPIYALVNSDPKNGKRLSVREYAERLRRAADSLEAQPERYALERSSTGNFYVYDGRHLVGELDVFYGTVKIAGAEEVVENVPAHDGRECVLMGFHPPTEKCMFCEEDSDGRD